MVNFLEKDELDRDVKRDLNILGLRIRSIIRSHHPRRRAESFRFAFKGVFHALVNEPNFRIQVFLVIVIIVMGFFYKINTTEWALLILSGGLLLSAEMINTVMEEFMDFIEPNRNGSVEVVKDLAAGFVLVMAVTSLAIFFLVFGKYILQSFI